MIKSNEIFSRLRECVDQYGTGFPATDTGVEIEILKLLFTEDEARMYMSLTPGMAPIRVIAENSAQSPEYVSAILADMKTKGLVMGFGGKDGEIYYVPAPFIPGFFEHNTFTMDLQLAELCERYLKGGFKQKEIFLRTIPVETAVMPSTSVTSYNDIRKILKSKNRIGVTKCACMNHQILLGKKFYQPLDVCFGFDHIADYYKESGHGRYITLEEALDIIIQCEKACLVPNPSKGDNILALCNCGKACGHLDQLRMRPRPADDAESSYHAKVDSGLCSACEICTDICHMAAISIGSSDVAQINLDKCIGCGICVSVCPEGAVGLELKE